jgi:cytoskeletal protein CcmA (bactofilin family)
MGLKMKDSGNGGRGVGELNFIGEGTVLEGKIETKGSLRIDGKVKGAIRTADTLTIGMSGRVEGEIFARNAVVGGRIEGNISVEDKLVLEAKSVLIGNLKAKKLVIDEGAVFQGKSDMDAKREGNASPAAPMNEKNSGNKKS